MKKNNAKKTRNAWMLSAGTRNAQEFVNLTPPPPSNLKTGNFGFVVLFLISLSFIFTTCDNMIGLGNKVNTEVPVISGGDDGVSAGAFIQGDGKSDESIIWLNVDQPAVGYYIEEVFMTIEYVDKNGTLQTKRVDGFYDEEKGQWGFNIDTSDMMDGQIKSIVTAIDSSGKSTSTTEMVYTVKNTPPQLEMTIPSIVGSDYENLHFYNPVSQALPLIYASNNIMGIATDLFGIEAGFPQIMIWPAEDNGTIKPGIILDNDDADISNAREWGTWRTVLDDKDTALSQDKLKAIMFRWTTKKLIKDGNIYRTRNDSDGTPVYPDDYFSVGRYHFKIRVKDKFGMTNIYPYRTDSGLSKEEHPNQYMSIYVAETANPVITFDTADRFYNASTFSGPLVRTLTINSKNGVYPNNVEALVSTSLSALFNDPEYATYVERISGNDTSGEFKVTIPASVVRHVADNKSNDNMMLHVRAQDVQGNFTVTSLNFILDIDNSSMEFISPLGLEKEDDMTMSNSKDGLTSTVKIMGTTSDPSTRVLKMYYALGKTEVAAATDSLSPTDLTGWIDTNLNNPKTDGSPTLAGHPNGGINASWYGTLNNWRWEFNNIRDVYLAGSQATMPNGNGFLYNDTRFNYGNSNIWHLPIKFKLVDSAGNVTIYKVVVLVDPDKDRPDVEVNSHSQTDPLTVVGGEVRVNGIATDNEIIYDVQIRVTAQTDSEIGTANMTNVVTANQKGSGAEGWVPVTMIGGGSSVNWYFILNRDDSSLPNGVNTAGLTPPNVETVRRVKLEVRARDASIYTPNTPKPIHQNHIVEVIELNFSATVPTITDITLIHDSPSIGTPNPSGGEVYNIGATVSGEIIIKAKIEDDQGITSIKIKGSEAAEFTANLIQENNPLGTPVSNAYPGSFQPWVVKTVTGPNDPVVYYVYIPLNTNGTSSNYGLWGGRYHNSAGTYSLDIQIMDNTNPLPYMAQTTVALQVDNYYPGSNYSGNLNATGTQYTVSGYAWDTGDSNISVFDVDKIVVYFSRPGGGGEIGGSGASGVMAGSQVNLDGTTTGSNGDWVATQRVKINRRSTDSTTPSEEGSIVTLPMFPVQTAGAGAGRYQANNAGYVINAQGGTLGSTQSFRDMPNKLWSVQVDTTKIADGPLYVNYVVFDKAGNAAFYRTEIYVANKKPIIKNVHVGTDIDRSGGITANEYYEYDPDPASTAFRVRNNRFNVKLDITGGNGQKSYRISNVRPISTAVAATTITKGNVYTIETMGGITVDEWINMGVIGGPANNNYAGITFTANNDYTGSNYGGVNPARVFEYRYGGTTNPTNTLAQGTTATGTATLNTYVSGTNIGAADLTNFELTAFTNTNFGGTTAGTALIPDSTKGTDGIVTTAGTKQRFFMIKVWDSTRSGMNEEFQLADVQVIAVDIDNNDSRPPVVSVKPFYWNSETDNSLYNNDRAYGHIELEANTAAIATAGPSLDANLRDGDPKVSGIVSFRGTSYDSNNIGSFYIRISNHTNTQGTTITQPQAGGNTHYLAATFNGGTSWTVENRMAANGWSFHIEPGSEPDINGHTVNWRLDYDSTFINNNGDAGTNNGRTDLTANLNNIFTIVALDAAQNRSPTTNPTTWAASMQTTAATPTEHYRFDIVPYIREIFTPLSQAFKSSPSAFARSAHGWYPVKESAADTERIEIKGFNLRGTAATSYITINGTALTALTLATSSNTYADTFNKDVPSNRYTHVVGRVVGIASGPMLVTINDIPSLNNVNDNNAEYNKEPNNSNNNILTDNRSFYVWNVGSLLTRDATNRSLDYPFLRVSSSGHRFLTYNHGVSTAALILNNNQASVTSNGTSLESDTNRYLNLTAAADSAGLWYIGASNMTARDYNSFHLHARGAATGGSYQHGRNKARILSLGPSTGGDYNRVRIPRVHARNTGTNASMIAISYGNNSQTYNDINFHYGRADGAANSALFSQDFVAALTTNTQTNYGNDTSQLATVQNVTNNSSNHKGSQYTAVATLSTTAKLGIPVIAWYDKEMQRLLISYGNQPPATDRAIVRSTTAIADWQGRATIVKEAAGTHVDMAVDGNDNIHLAYYDVFNGGLWYTFIPAAGITAYTAGGTTSRAQVTGMKTVKVDTYLSAGTKITINVRQHGTGNFVPYISYFHSSFAETRNSIRVAWPTTTAGVVKFHNAAANVLDGTDENDRFLGNWEVMTVPAANVPSNEFFIANGALSTTTNWVAPTGTDAVVSYANMNRTVLVGYMTDNRYEGAILKYDIWSGSN